jgi:hypothetical protein
MGAVAALFAFDAIVTADELARVSTERRRVAGQAVLTLHATVVIRGGLVCAEQFPIASLELLHSEAGAAHSVPEHSVTAPSLTRPSARDTSTRGTGAGCARSTLALFEQLPTAASTVTCRDERASSGAERARRRV